MTNTNEPTRTPRPAPYGMDEEQAELLARLNDRYADAVPEVRARTPEASLPALLHAVNAHQVRRVLASNPHWQKTTGITEAPEDHAEDVASALALLQIARADLEKLEAALLLAARFPSSRTGKPLLTFPKIADAIGAESGQAAQDRYRRRVGAPNATATGVDGTP